MVEGRKEGGREGGIEGQRKRGREGQREEGRREGGREGQREAGRKEGGREEGLEGLQSITDINRYSQKTNRKKVLYDRQKERKAKQGIGEGIRVTLLFGI